MVVMGVSGCGKSALGQALAAALGCPFVEGDDLHPPANRAKMAAGVPLDDEDRRPFLDGVARAIAAPREGALVVACSALKRDYRQRILAAGEVVFLLPLADRETLLGRLRRRQGHFMPASLLESQLSTLELPSADEPVVTLDGAWPVAVQVERALAALSAGEPERADIG